MKRKSAKEILADSFREVAKTKNIDKITIKDITDNCGYSSATFYRQFKDKYDLIAWSYAQRTAEIMARIGLDDYEWRQTLLDAAQSFKREKAYLSNLLLHTSGHDSFIKYMVENNSRELDNYIKKTTGRKILDKKTEMYIRLYSLGTVCLTSDWLLGGLESTPEEMAEIYENSIPGPLRPLLLKKPKE